ncbi:unnamed protein product [Clavelina lepadiformis]|uniref:ubiquitinyl hydrolase 1 n=1 Tax=Clavelina lepadiformis TaxID=159417 RepID=A0ABP0GZG3_CLALP
MVLSAKDKGKRKKSAFKSFGNFIALHMVKRFVWRKTAPAENGADVSNETDKDAIEAGFDANMHQNGHANGSNTVVVSRSSSLHTSNSTSLSVMQSKVRSANGLVNGSGADIGLLTVMPGVFGLTNHGNTCFMNSVTQCLSNTDFLAEYFVMGQYKTDLKSCRKDRSKKYGTKGEVAEQLAAVIKSLWTGSCSSEMTKSLKDTIGKYASQYKGTIQHDSQEFLLWLFDKLHEDLNQMPVKKRTFSRKQSFRKSRKLSVENNKNQGDNMENASKAKSNLDLQPNSFIQKVFQGHYRSSLSCPNCKKQSDTTDPFLCVSLPIRQRTTRPIYVNVVYLPNKRRSSSSRKSFAGRTLKVGVTVEIEGKINHLRQGIAAECGIHSRLLAFVELHHDGFHQSYGDDKSISDIPMSNATTTASSMSLYAFEMPAIAKMTAGTLPRNFTSKQKRRGTFSSKQGKDGTTGNNTLANVESVVVILINKQGIKEQGKRFGRPLVFRTSRDVLQSELQSIILSQMSDHLKNGVKHERLGNLFRLQVMDGLPNKSYLSQQTPQPLREPTVDRALENSPAGGPMHIKLVAEWDTDTKSGIFEKFPEEKVEVQDSVRLQRVLHQQPVTCTLEECFDLHTQEEELGPEDAWLCPHCHKHQQGTVKKLSLYTLPDIFVLHLKRFRVANGRRTKLSTRVEFPITGLNMSKHLYRPDSSYAGQWSSSVDCLYDLYAVCNHYGNLNSGHYTACCCNPLDGKWYLFDDSHTECIGEDALSPQAVYILFYQKRSSAAALSCGGASVNSVMSDHWAYNLPQFKHKIEFNSQRHLNQHSVNPVSRNVTFSHSRIKPSNESKQNNTTSPISSSMAMQININNNSNKIAAVARELQSANQKTLKDKKEILDEDSDDGGFDSPNRPYVRGLRRQGSAIIGKFPSEQQNPEVLRGRQYRSYRHNRKTRRQQSSHV